MYINKSYHWFQHDIENMSNEELFSIALNEIEFFMTYNNLPMPTIIPSIFKSKNLFGKYMYKSKHILVSLDNCFKVSNKKYSFPSLRDDNTIIGVIAHETGHYIDYLLKIYKNKQYNLTTEVLSNYEKESKDKHESIAEALRMFILNPELLKFYARKKYDFFINEIKLKPHITKFTHLDVLTNAYYNQKSFLFLYKNDKIFHIK